MGEDGAKVGEDSTLEGGSMVGSKSRSGSGGESRGRHVTFKSKRRSTALEVMVSIGVIKFRSTHLLDSFNDYDSSPTNLL